jgi:hypothetical protein
VPFVLKNSMISSKYMDNIIKKIPNMMYLGKGATL